mgnify:FL=1
MVCKKCEEIALQIQCQSCGDDICNSCDNGICEADEIVKRGSVNGHPVEKIIIEKK